MILAWLGRHASQPDNGIARDLMEHLGLFIFAGFMAQMVDGMLGMAYGVSCNSLLLALGIPPAAASASVHVAKLFTTSFSGFFHWKLGNVDPDIWKKLVLPGIMGGIIGATIVTKAPVHLIKPVISAYLVIIGVTILMRACKKELKPAKNKRLKTLGFFGGFCDAIGGGGWGPVVTSSLVARGTDPRLTVGSVNLAEFFVTMGTCATFFLTLGVVNTWEIISGLIIGGLLASPVAAIACKKVNPQPLMACVGLLIIALSAYALIQGQATSSHAQIAGVRSVTK